MARLQHSYPVDGRGVFGVAICDSLIYLTQCECNWINVFSASDPYDFLDKIDIPEMTNPSDILVFECCLYIPDNMSPKPHIYFNMKSDRDHCVWKIPLSNSASPIQPEKMLTSLEEWWPWTLSRTLDGSRIIITTLRNKVYFWSPEQNVCEVVTLHPDVHGAQHIIELSCQSYLICFRSCPKNPCHVCLQKVRRLVRKGNEMHFAENPSSLDVHHPRHLLELPDGRILVPDHIKNRVLVLAKDLKNHTVLLHCGPESNDKTRPCRVAYDSSSKKLVVAFHHSAGLYSLDVDRIEVQH